MVGFYRLNLHLTVANLHGMGRPELGSVYALALFCSHLPPASVSPVLHHHTGRSALQHQLSAAAHSAGSCPGFLTGGSDIIVPFGRCRIFFLFKKEDLSTSLLLDSELKDQYQESLSPCGAPLPFLHLFPS